MNKSFFIIIFLSIVILVHIFLCENVIINFSPTYDEPIHLFQGYSYLKTGLLQTVAPYDHPMLGKIISAIGLLLLRPNPVVFNNHSTWLNRQRYSFANLMLYYNNNDAEKMLNMARRMVVLVSVIFIITLFFVVRNTLGTISSFFVIVLYSFNNTIIANATLVTQDFIFSVFYLLSVYFFYLWSKKKDFMNIILTGIFFSLAMNTKFSGIILVVSFAISIFFMKIKKEIKMKEVIYFLFTNTVIFILIILLIYGIDNFILFFESLFITLKNLQEGRSTFFLGQYSTKGFWNYFLVLVLLKTEIPLLLIFLYRVVSSIIFKKEQKSRLNIILLFNIILILFLASFSKTQIGQRHLLPMYFLVIWFVGKIVNDKKLLPLIIGLTLWYIIISFKTNPWHLSYFNEFVGNEKKLHTYFTDSNIDWGQGLKSLGKWVKENKQIDNNGIYMSYFGVGDPKYYGIKYRPIGFVTNLILGEREGENILKNRPEKIYLAVSLTNLHSTYYQDKTIFNFLHNVEPLKVVAKSIYVYDINKSENIRKNFIQLLKKINYVEDIKYFETIARREKSNE